MSDPSHPVAGMPAVFSPKSLRYEYELYVEQEIEYYKGSIPRVALLRIGDEAVTSLQQQEQTSFDEILLWAEVDRIIRNRLRVPAFNAWKRRRLRRLEEYRRPERWGLTNDGPLVCAIRTREHAHVLVAGARAEGPAIFLAANGCQVTALNDDPDLVDRVIHVAGEAGLISRFTQCVSALERFEPAPDAPLSAVFCTSDALQRLPMHERTRVINTLKSATLDGGVHLVQTIAAGTSAALSLDELTSQYTGWATSVVPDRNADQVFLARKLVA